MDKATNGFNGHANSMKGVLLDAKAEQQAAQVMNSIREQLPNLAGKSKEKITQGVTNFLENNLKLTKAGVNVVEFNNEFAIFPSFSINGTIIHSPGKILLEKRNIAVSV